jgi:hypothetical protein
LHGGDDIYRRPRFTHETYFTAHKGKSRQLVIAADGNSNNKGRGPGSIMTTFSPPPWNWSRLWQALLLLFVAWYLGERIATKSTYQLDLIYVRG